MDTVLNPLWNNAVVGDQTHNLTFSGPTHLNTAPVNDFKESILEATIDKNGHSWLNHLHSFTKPKMQPSIHLIHLI